MATGRREKNPFWRGGRTIAVTLPHLDSISWVVVGGESGAGHRTMKLEWLESVVAQCDAAGVPVFVKQDSGRRPGKQGRIPDEWWTRKEMTA